MISQVAYFLVQSLAFCRYFFLSVLKILATSGINGSSGFGSVIKACNDNNTTKKTIWNKFNTEIIPQKMQTRLASG